MRAQGLEAELRVVSAAERRASNEASSLSSDKFRLAAELEAARGAHAEREGELVKELSRLREEVRFFTCRAGVSDKSTINLCCGDINQIHEHGLHRYGSLNAHLDATSLAVPFVICIWVPW